MLGGSQGLGGASQRTGGLWPLASAPVSPATSFTSDGYSKYGFYSLFSGAPTFGSTLYSHNTVGRFGPALQAPGATAFHTTHKVSDSLFSATGYTFGAPTPPPGSPYSPVPVAQLEFLTKGYTTTTNSNIIIQQSPICQQDLSNSPNSLSPTKKANQIIITPSSSHQDKDLKMNNCNGIGCGSAFRSSQSTFKHQQAQYIYAQQPNSNQTLDGSCMLKLTTLTSDQKECHSGGANITGCSRTNPLEWTTLSPIHVKKEPGTLVLSDCGQGEAIIKMEMTSPVQKSVGHQELIQQTTTSMPSIVTANGNIPVGIAVGRQRIQQEVAPSGILTTTHFKEVARISEIDLNAAHHHHAALQQQQHHHHNQQQHAHVAQSAAASATADCWGLMGGMTAAAAAAAAQQQHCHPGGLGGLSSGAGTQQNAAGGGTTLWTTAQYPTPLPMEPLLPMSAVGLPLQLVREPTSGGFLLFPTAGIEPVQQAAAIQLWPNSATTYPSPSPGHVILPPLPPPPLQLLTSAQAHQHQSQQDNSSSYQHLSMIQAAAATTSNCNNNHCATITTFSNNNSGLASVNTINQSARLHLLSSCHNPAAVQQQNVFGTTIEQQQGATTKFISSKGCQSKMSSGLGTVIKVEEGSIMQQTTCSQQINSVEHQNQQDVTSSNLQIFETSPPVLTTTHVIYQPTPTLTTSTHSHINVIETSHTPEQIIQTNAEQTWKQSIPTSVASVFSTTTCRSQATSPVTCLTPPLLESGGDAVSNIEIINDATIRQEVTEEVVKRVDENEKQVVEEKLVQDASNQTEAISDEETSLVESKENQDINVPNLENIEILETKEDEESCKENIVEADEMVPSEAEVVPTESEVEIAATPDFSGLDLLSNSILEHETSKNIIEPPEKVVPDVVVVKLPLPLVEENLGGLDLLCALAEQRLEEVTSSSKNCEKVVKPPVSMIELDGDAQEEEEEEEEEEPEAKKAKIDENLPRRCNNCNCNVDDEPFKNYKTKESEQEFKKFIASKAPSLMEYHYKEMTANGLMNDNERDMRQQLADLQRKYKEKQRELNKLKPHHHSGSKKLLDCQNLHQKKKHRKKSVNSNGSTDRDTSPPPPILEPQVDLSTIQQNKITNSDKTEESLIIRSETSTSTTTNKFIEKRRHSSSNSSSNPLKRRRKVGRPKKLEWSSDNESSSNNNLTSTETIVAKKPKKTHQNLVGYLLAAKEKLLIQKEYSTDSPPRFIEEVPVKISGNNKKIGPKLKAEARVSMEMSSSDDFLDEENRINPPNSRTFLSEDSEIEDCIEEPIIIHTPTTQQEINEEDSTKPLENNFNTSEFSSDDSRPLKNFSKLHSQVQTKPEEPIRPIIDTRCILTQELLESDRLRVLTAMGGLFYAGNLNAVQPPDVYSITLDGERGNRPHIMSREEILRDAIVEVSPSSPLELSPGTRLCAYWSQQYRCLYPGSVAEPASPSASPVRDLDKRFVAVEFDDGDNGTIAIEDIRLLPSDYPIIEYDPNPLLSLSKRKRRLSTTEDRKFFTQSPPISSTTKSVSQTRESPQNQSVEKENKDLNININNPTKVHDSELQKVQRNKERKRLKKRKRDKLREKQSCLSNIDGETLKKKKKRKHKCLGELCKHRRHHKKHKKHRRHQKRDNRDKKVIKDNKQFEKNGENVEAVEEIEEVFPEYHIVPNPDDEVTMDDIIEDISKTKSKKIRDRQESCESRSKMSAFLPPRQFWNWSGKGYKRPRGKGRSKKEFFKSIQRGKENMSVGDSAVFLSTGRPDRPYIGKIEAFWETCGTMVVKVKWFYHPEETNGCPLNLKYPGALFESPHVDENDVQTISHRCRVVPLSEYTATLGSDPTRYATIYDNNDIYYRAGYYDPTTCQLTMDKEIPLEDE